MITLLKSKIHRATVTKCDLTYDGSISIGSKLRRAANIAEYEQVHVWNVTNGERFVTYVIDGGKNNDIAINGAGARLCQPGDLVIIATFVQVDVSSASAPPRKPLIIQVDSNNVTRDNVTS